MAKPFTPALPSPSPLMGEGRGEGDAATLDGTPLGRSPLTPGPSPAKGRGEHKEAPDTPDDGVPARWQMLAKLFRLCWWRSTNCSL